MKCQYCKNDFKNSPSDVPMASNATDGMDEFAKSDVKNYRAHFRHLVVPYSSLQFNESLGEG